MPDSGVGYGVVVSSGKFTTIQHNTHFVGFPHSTGWHINTTNKDLSYNIIKAGDEKRKTAIGLLPANPGSQPSYSFYPPCRPIIILAQFIS